MNPILRKVLEPVSNSDSLWRLFHKSVGRVAQAGLELRAEAVFNARFGDLVVRDGLFKGMKYPEVGHTSGSSFFPKVLGTYEQEVYPVLAAAVAGGIGDVVDVGCAEGYYAIGMALVSPASTVHAFDTNAEAIAMCQELARLNGVSDRVKTGGWCDPAALLALDLRPRSLVISDCEGYEKELLTPEVIARLAACFFLVEVHDCYDPTISGILLERFAGTHRVTRIASVADKTGLRNRADLQGIPNEILRCLTFDRESPMEWFWCEPSRQ
jgi:hypothetical protein